MLSLSSSSQDVHHPVVLCALAFSDYALWSNPTLRDPNRDGFIPLRTLLHASPVFLAANAVSLTEAAIVKSLRAHARDTFDIRMILVDKTRPRRSNHGNSLAGGYEVRRKDWAEATHRFPTFNQEYWDALTIYVENIPFQFRSIVGISELLYKLLPREHAHSSPLHDYCFIQAIYLPPHHQDPPDALPKCKGFALVTLSEPSATSHLLAHFPYHNRSAPADVSDAPSEELEARKAGFRTLSKERWEALQSEYVEYHDTLLHHTAATSAVLSHNPPASGATRAADKIRHSATNRLPCELNPRASDTPPNYPLGCVVFARHVPQDTNKTALRARFSALLEEGDPTALDYVDYTKGLDSCYLRLTTREHALSLLRRFEGGANGEEIVLELLEGRREEMYWQDVPDKVRALAVQRAQAHQAPRGERRFVHADDEDASVENGGGDADVETTRTSRHYAPIKDPLLE
ncbi:hypothetical protein F5148DRAFT_236214 [Russula earlei]|uniref:Uncharacterized protein n=1 Tax=Russula earlei TaxID=71964 RepID=A0ACC0U4Q2_9AGAM|nr:hypothetical protein F5148DRAFT_236214 [Russula earlei]